MDGTSWVTTTPGKCSVRGLVARVTAPRVRISCTIRAPLPPQASHRPPEAPAADDPGPRTHRVRSAMTDGLSMRSIRHCRASVRHPENPPMSGLATPPVYPIVLRVAGFGGCLAGRADVDASAPDPRS